MLFPQNITISTNKWQLDIPLIHQFLTNSYWGSGRSLETIKQSIEHSFCFGVYDNNQQIGFARVISDCTIFGYIMDVFILETHQGKGLGQLLMKTILEDAQFKDVQKWLLGTKDAHGVYQKLGFTELKYPERWMQLFVNEKKS